MKEFSMSHDRLPAIESNERMKTLIRSLVVVFVLVTSLHAADYFPLAKGNSWNYTFSEIIFDSSYTVGVRMAVACDTVIGADSVFGIKMWADSETVPDEYAGYYMVRGNYVFTLDSLNQPRTDSKMFEHFPKAGDGWKNDNGDTFTVIYFGTITVPAGTFDSCFATVDKNNDTVFVFAPNVGLVRIFHVGNSLFELTAYSVHIPNSVVRPAPNAPLAPEKVGIHQGRYSLLNALGKWIDIVTIGKNGAMNRRLAKGTYFLVEKDPGTTPVKRAVKLTITGK
jgi:hypothetical protein